MCQQLVINSHNVPNLAETIKLLTIILLLDAPHASMTERGNANARFQDIVRGGPASVECDPEVEIRALGAETADGGASRVHL